MQTARPFKFYELLTPFIVFGGLVSVGLLVLSELNIDMIMDWLGREGGTIFVWWLLVTLASVPVMPLLFRLLPSLPSRGYALGRAAGLMAVGFVFWLMGMLGFWANTPGAILLAWLLVGFFGLWVWRHTGTEETFDFRPWLRDHAVFIVVTELVFIALLVGWAVFRAHEPEIRTTEKPMEVMFVSSIRQSEFFPPSDGWLSGYSISYYYFGYLITAGLADLSGVSTGFAFGLIGPLLFALAGIGILGLVYDLVRVNNFTDRWLGGSSDVGIWAGLLGVILLLFMGNLGTFFVEMPWNGRGLMSQYADVDYFEFWGVPERSRIVYNRTPLQSIGEWVIPSEERVLLDSTPSRSDYTFAADVNQNGIPDFEEGGSGIDARTGESVQLSKDFQNWDYWWWFRHSRVIEDRFLNGKPIGIQPIAEFPHFSFVLSDIHPHVLALPFALLALTLAAGHALNKRSLAWWGYLLMAVWVGGMVFMNTWDAVYLVFLICAEALRRLMLARGRGLTLADIGGVVFFGLGVGLLTFALYWPWIASFTSQAGGVYPNIIWPTAPQQLFLQFGAFFILLAPFLLLEIWWGRLTIHWAGVGMVSAALLLLLMVILPALFGLVIDASCNDIATDTQTIQNQRSACRIQDILFGGDSPNRNPNFWRDILDRRLPSYFSQGAMLIGLTLIGFRLFGRSADERSESPHKLPYHPATGIALLMMAAGIVLALVPDFVYLVDNFGVRINTVFKLYYQAWILFSVAAAYSVYVVLSGLGMLWKHAAQPAEPDTDHADMVYPPRVGWRMVYVLIAVIVVGMGMTYPYYAGRARALDETGRYGERRASLNACANEGTPESECETLFGRDLTLDGVPNALQSPDDYAILQCLQDLNPGPAAVLAEAPFNGGYWAQGVDYSRMSMLTGIPTLLGWINHEGQWRGDTYDTVTETVYDANGVKLDSREMAADRLYRTTDWETAQQVIKRYGISYIMVGHAERVRYEDAPAGLDKFKEWYPAVCTSGASALYHVEGD